MAEWRSKAGKTEIRINPDPSLALRAAADAAVPGARRALEAAADSLLEHARSRWPVSRRPRGPGRETPSRDLLRSEAYVDASGLTSSVVSPAPYTRFIRSNQNGLGGRNPWQVLVRDQVTTPRVLAIGKAVTDAVAAGLGEG